MEVVRLFRVTVNTALFRLVYFEHNSINNESANIQNSPKELPIVQLRQVYTLFYQ